MTDIVDQAQAINEDALERALQAHASKPETKLVPTGFCLNFHCAEELPEGRLFCDSDCAIEYHRLSRNK